MKISEVISLLKAGYSKKEIEELRASETAVLDPLTVVTEEKPEETPPAAPAAAAAPVSDNSEVLKAIENLTRIIQTQNVRNDTITPVHTDSAVDILGSVINSNKK